MEDVNQNFIDKLARLCSEYDECVLLMQTVEVASDPKLLKFYQIKEKELKDLAEKFKSYNQTLQEIELTNELIEVESNPEEKAKLKLTVQNLLGESETILNEAKTMFLSQEKHGTEKIRIEISSKSEGYEFADELENMFFSYFRFEGYKIDIQKSAKNSKIFFVEGKGVYQKFSRLSGLYERVFRGKITNAVVVILEEKIFSDSFDESDFEIQTSKSSGAGGQHINKTESAIRIKHIPTGLVSECEDERSQTKNKERAMQNLKEKIISFYKSSNEEYSKKQRNNLKSAIFSNTPIIIFDEDRNIVTLCSVKKDYKLQEVKSGSLTNLINDIGINGTK